MMDFWPPWLSSRSAQSEPEAPPLTQRSSRSDAPLTLVTKQARLVAANQRREEIRRHGVAAALLLELSVQKSCVMCRAFELWREMPVDALGGSLQLELPPLDLSAAAGTEDDDEFERIESAAAARDRLEWKMEREAWREDARLQAAAADHQLRVLEVEHLYEKQELNLGRQRALKQAEFDKSDLLAQQAARMELRESQQFARAWAEIRKLKAQLAQRHHHAEELTRLRRSELNARESNRRLRKELRALKGEESGEEEESDGEGSDDEHLNPIDPDAAPQDPTELFSHLVERGGAAAIGGYGTVLADLDEAREKGREAEEREARLKAELEARHEHGIRQGDELRQTLQEQAERIDEFERIAASHAEHGRPLSPASQALSQRTMELFAELESTPSHTTPGALGSNMPHSQQSPGAIHLWSRAADFLSEIPDTPRSLPDEGSAEGQPERPVVPPLVMPVHTPRGSGPPSERVRKAIHSAIPPLRLGRMRDSKGGETPAQESAQGSAQGSARSGRGRRVSFVGLPPEDPTGASNPDADGAAVPVGGSGGAGSLGGGVTTPEANWPGAAGFAHGAPTPMPNGEGGLPTLKASPTPHHNWPGAAGFAHGAPTPMPSALSAAGSEGGLATLKGAPTPAHAWPGAAGFAHGAPTPMPGFATLKGAPTPKHEWPGAAGFAHGAPTPMAGAAVDPDAEQSPSNGNGDELGSTVDMAALASQADELFAQIGGPSSPTSAQI